ncbi:hypothetical protein METBIDRAFT_23699, partial [Metschnikowia bicuspidata var. bicuspidata NRRL YB-4993]
ENGNDKEDDMFASDKEESEPQRTEPKGRAVIDIAQFEKDQGLEDYEFNAGMDKDEIKPHLLHLEVQLEAFNLREEAESGNFDKDMNYIQHDKSDSEDDEPWMAGVSVADIEKARKAQQKSSRAGSQKYSVSSKSVPEILPDLILVLEPAETPMEALSRLRPEKKKLKQKTADLNETERKNAVFKLTDCCEQLVNDKGMTGAYDMSREELMRAYFQETGVNFQPRGVKRDVEQMEKDDGQHGTIENQHATGENQYGKAIWEFRWVDDTEVHGPYSSYEMDHWKKTYFENRVEVRRIGDPVFCPVAEVLFS